MNLRHFVLRGIAEAVSVMRSTSIPAPSYRILMYHSVGGKVAGDRLDIFGVAPRRFAQHMALLAQEDSVTVVGLDSMYLDSTVNRMAITFDDGYKDNLYAAAPILAEYAFPFTVFVSSGFVQSNSRQFLSPAELRELVMLPNVTIGAHGLTHIALTACNDHELQNELFSSKHFLEDMIGRPVTALAYPYGAVNMRVRDAAQAAGYTLGTCSYMGTNYIGQDPLLLSRTSILGIDAPRVFKQKIRGHWDWYKRLQQNPASS